MDILSRMVKVIVAIIMLRTKVVTKAMKREKELEIKRIDAESKKIETLENLKKLHDSGAITDREYRKTKKRLLNK